jgi:hypothetical protein
VEDYRSSLSQHQSIKEIPHQEGGILGILSLQINLSGLELFFPRSCSKFLYKTPQNYNFFSQWQLH